MKLALLVILFGQSVELPAEVKAEPGAFAVVPAKTDCASLRWVVLDPGLSMLPPELLKDSRTAVVMSGRPGRYRLLAYGAKGDQASAPAYATVVVGDAPKPPPDPDPDDPNPPLGPAPIPVAGLRVLIVFESADQSTLSSEHRAIIFGKPFRDLLNAKCVVGPDGVTKEYRIFDKETPMEGDAKLWRDAMSRPRSAVPWLLISNGTSGFEGPLPATAAEAAALVSKFAGGK